MSTMERIEQGIDRDYCKAVKAENAKAQRPRKPRLTAAEKRARAYEEDAFNRAAAEAERIAKHEAWLLAEEERKAVEKVLADSRRSPRSFHLTAADAIREAMIDGHRETWEQWDDVLAPFEKHLTTLPQDGKAYLLIEALLEQAQAKLEAHLNAQDALLTEALELLGERP